MSKWPELPLGELVECGSPITYGVVKPGVEVEDGVLFVRSQDIKNGAVDFSRLRTITEDISENYRRTRLRGGELLVSLVGTPGQTAIADQSLTGANIARQVGLVRLDREKSSPKFVHYFLRSETGRARLASVTHGSVQQVINLRDIRLLPVPVPSLLEQRGVSAVLGALDDKIAVNERIVQACDEFRTLQLSRYIAEHPSMIVSLPLSATAQFINGRAFTKGATGSGRMVIRIAEMNSGPGASTVYNSIDVSREHLAFPGDILFAWSGSLAVLRWFRPEAIVNQHIFKVIPEGELPHWLIFELIKSKLSDFKLIAAGKATTMGHIQRHHLNEPVNIPVAEETKKLDQELGPLWDRALWAEQESLVLAELRDALLPRLMSGELRVSDAEQMVGDVT